MGRLRIVSGRMNKRTRLKVVRWGIIGGNVALLLMVGIFLLSNRSASQTVRASTLSSATTAANSIANPLDQLSSAQIALNAAQMSGLPDTTAIRNQADSENLLLAVVPNDSTALSKPQVVTTAEKSKHDIIHYVTVEGDTVSGLSAKFNITPSSIRWSNNINGDALKSGTDLAIPPVNGVVYTVKSGDTPSSLASRYSADANLIIVYNDAEVSGLAPGEQILIPNGTIAPVISVVSFAAAYGGNGYSYGFCTWYVANRIAIPTNWGNAVTWALYAQLSGWTVSSTPIVGAIAQRGGGAGHVAVVEAVDGTMIKYSDMNGLAGWGKAGTTPDWVSASTFQHYIYH